MSTAREALEQSFQLAWGYHRAGRLAEAEEIYRQILAAHPSHGETLHSLALIAMHHGYLEEAAGLLRRAIAASPRNAEFHNTLGVVGKSLGDLSEAEKCYRQAIKRRPGYSQAMSNLSALLNEQFRWTEALEWAGRAVAINPDFAGLLNLGNALGNLGRAEQAVDAHRRCAALAPGHWPAWSGLLLGLHYLPDTSAEDLFALHVRVGSGMSEGLESSSAFSNARDPARRLRVGYVSADFRLSSVSHFVLPILRSHDRSAVQVYCYSDVGRVDEVTAEVQSLASAWRPIRGMSHEAVAQAVREDGIDVLVDLSGHTSDRLPVFARRAAPVQVTYLGYPDTTGLPAMDYRLTDSFADPSGNADARASEKLVRLDPCAWCYAPSPAAPPVEPRPEGSVTFGSFNALIKVSGVTMDAWASILQQVPGSRLMIKALALKEASARERFVLMMQQRGIASDRLIVRGHQAELRAHLAAYGEMDIALDPFPYNGTTTTCDALWMGVPLISLAGDTHVSRVGASLLHAVGLGELVAPDRDRYVRLAVELAADGARLAALRAGLRERMRRSALMDAAGFCKRLEDAYRGMWRTWCSRGP